MFGDRSRDNDDYRFFDGRRNVYRIRVETTKSGDNALNFDPDGMSVFWKEHMELHGLDYRALIDPVKPLIFEAVVSDIRDLRPGDRRLHVVYTPEGDEPIGCAHASVLPPVRMKGAGTEAELVREALESVLVHRYGEPSEGPPPGA